MFLRIVEFANKGELTRAVQEFYSDQSVAVQNIQYGVSVRGGVVFYTAFVTCVTVYDTDRY